jgi:hypothetical protein
MRFCTGCGTALQTSDRVCRNCGQVATEVHPLGTHLSVSHDSGVERPIQIAPSVEAVCPKCGGDLQRNMEFCTRCGASVHASAIGIPAGVQSLFRRINQEKTGLAAAAVVFGTGTLVSWIGWTPLSLPARIINSKVPQGDCTNLNPGTFAMYLCSAKVAALTLVGPAVVMVGLLLFQKPLTRAMKSVLGFVPDDARFLVAPTLATTLFAAVWSGAHFSGAEAQGLVSQATFPALVGLFTFLVSRYGPKVLSHPKLRRFFEARDRISAPMRFLIAAGTTLAFSLYVTYQDRVSQETLKEQLTVLVGVASAFLAMAPQSGNIGTIGEFLRRGDS